MTISNFTAFCKKIDDKYKVELEEDFVFKFTNSSGDVFNVNPCEVKDFIRFFIENYSSIENTWEKVPSRKKFIDQWEEKSYRAIYKYAEDNGEEKDRQAGFARDPNFTQVCTPPSSAF